MKKLLLFGLILVQLVGMSLSVVADQLQDAINKKNSIDKTINSILKEQKEVAAEKKSLEAEKKNVEKEEEKENSEYQTILDDLDAINAEIEKINADVEQAEREYENRKEEVKARLRYMYESSEISIFETLLSCKSITDFFERIELMSLIAKIDQQAIEALEAAKKDVEYKRKMRVEKQEELQQAAAEKKERLEQLSISRASLEDRIKQSQRELEMLERRIDELNKESAKLESTIKSLSTKKKYVEGDMVWPLPSGTKVVSSYGMRLHPILKKNKMHTGIDIDGKTGDSIVAANNGTVIISGWQSGYGNTVVIDHGGGITTLYAHCSKLLVKVGDEVKAGQVIAKVGSTGLATGPHLHFEVRKDGSPQNPLNYVKP